MKRLALRATKPNQARAGADVPTARANAGLSTLALSIAVGYVVGAIFRCDPGCPLAASWRQGIHNMGGGIEYVGGAVGLWRIGDAVHDGAANSLSIAFGGAAAIVAVAVVLMSMPALFRWRGAVQRVAEALLFAALVIGAGLLETRVAAV